MGVAEVLRSVPYTTSKEGRGAADWKGCRGEVGRHLFQHIDLDLERCLMHPNSSYVLFQRYRGESPDKPENVHSPEL